jgi:uncharacterized protein (DUF983 family)
MNIIPRKFYSNCPKCYGDFYHLVTVENVRYCEKCANEINIKNRKNKLIHLNNLGNIK